jgi:hypothetical protein
VSHRKLTSLVVVGGLVLAACGGADPDLSPRATTTVAPDGDQREEPDQDETPAPGGSGDEETPVEPSSGFDEDALVIPLMDASELPADIPVPVPAGGEPGTLAAFEGQSYTVEYPPGNLARIAAFYDAWFADQAIAVEPTFGSGDLELWRVNVDGIPVEIELYKVTNSNDERLFITWP